MISASSKYPRAIFSRALKAMAMACVIAAGLPGMALANGGMRNGLPPTQLDSFVREAGASAELIYGDEGHFREPPYKGFTEQHRINHGIVGQRNQGLTTGHGEYLPDAWGGDEFIGQAEWSQSGANNGSYTQYQEPSQPSIAPQDPFPVNAAASGSYTVASTTPSDSLSPAAELDQSGF